MTDDELFNDIRPYRDHEFRQVMDNLLSSEMADLLIKTVFPNVPAALVKQQLRKMDTIKAFQEQVIYKAVMGVLKKTATCLTKSGAAHLERGQNYLFVSNHRDIILDPSILNTTIFEQGFETAEIAIGDNLLETPWVKDLARLNKSFIVKRNLSVRELIAASRLLSDYIYEVIHNRKCSIWIAQREGRAKDGNDKTQPGLLNMIGMSAKGNLKQHYRDMNIVPVSISYELDPCDVDKARNLYALKFFGGYTKEKNEDNLAMRKGILGFKGEIHIHIGNSIASEIDALPENLHKNDLINKIGTLIDQQIIGNYCMHKSNWIAYDLLTGNISKNKYTPEEKNTFVQDIDSKIAAMYGDAQELKSIFLEMYARPLINKIQLEDSSAANL